MNSSTEKATRDVYELLDFPVLRHGHAIRPRRIPGSYFGIVPRAGRGGAGKNAIDFQDIPDGLSRTSSAVLLVIPLI